MTGNLWPTRPQITKIVVHGYDFISVNVICIGTIASIVVCDPYLFKVKLLSIQEFRSEVPLNRSPCIIYKTIYRNILFHIYSSVQNNFELNAIQLELMRICLDILPF